MIIRLILSLIVTPTLAPSYNSTSRVNNKHRGCLDRLSSAGTVQYALRRKHTRVCSRVYMRVFCFFLFICRDRTNDQYDLERGMCLTGIVEIPTNGMPPLTVSSQQLYVFDLVLSGLGSVFELLLLQGY
jgi:hypothetical protein